MSKQTEIILAGVGGQGMILSGTLLAQAAVLHDHRRATLSSEYGVETRGTFAKSDVIISDREIYFPDVTEPDLIVCLAQVAYEKYSGKCPKETIIVYNGDEVSPKPENSANERGVALTKLAKELGNAATANIVTMGIAAGLTGAVTPDGAKEAVRSFFGSKGEKVISLNIKAFEAGFGIGQSLR
jgi:2-oxoglutarate ferredoxin oxidoreductase subunit gamma